ncbi:hypothetical protein [uncultured Rikenella sp.]|uniref:hypothetical protein n=1 Tax=uncultured Rikenella sp. TaxID=368003 RepID=UPI002623DFF3|nr:hypothetical protein [uncultured Rikenella sp.]
MKTEERISYSVFIFNDCFSQQLPEPACNYINNYCAILCIHTEQIQIKIHKYLIYIILKSQKILIFSIQNYISSFSSPVFPAPGYRSSTTGALDGIGNEGSSWAVSAADIRGNRLVFNVGTVEPERLSWRAGGYPLRCLSE